VKSYRFWKTAFVLMTVVPIIGLLLDYVWALAWGDYPLGRSHWVSGTADG
jgi:hypothetical protein